MNKKIHIFGSETNIIKRYKIVIHKCLIHSNINIKCNKNSKEQCRQNVLQLTKKRDTNKVLLIDKLIV